MCIEDKVVCKWYQPHRWGKWYDVRDIVTGCIQHRECTRCGAKQIKFVMYQ